MLMHSTLYGGGLFDRVLFYSIMKTLSIDEQQKIACGQREQKRRIFEKYKHIKKIYFDSEFEEDSAIRNFRIVQTEGSREVDFM